MPLPTTALPIAVRTLRLLLITDPRYADDHIVRVARELGRALPRGAFGVQLRDKERDPSSVRALAKELRQVTKACGALFVVNRDVALALDVGADGVHLGGDGMALAAARSAFPPAWISVAAHRDPDVLRAAEGGAEAVLVSPVFETPGEAKGTPRGVGALQRAAATSEGRCVVYALGGVSTSRARACREAGADGVAVIRALLEANDPGAEAQRMWQELENHAPKARLY
jgi:thiamine-phosphate pyrophosphorylase